MNYNHKGWALVGAFIIIVSAVSCICFSNKKFVEKTTVSDHMVHQLADVPLTTQKTAEEIAAELPPRITELYFNNSKKLLRVTSLCDTYPECWQHDVAINDPATKEITFLGSIRNVSYTGNSGAVFMPIALTKDDKNMILEAHMGDPGAGGGSEDYGYALLPVAAAAGPDHVFSAYNVIAAHNAQFYDGSERGISRTGYGKVVSVEDDTSVSLACSQPGPSNDGAIVFRNLVTGATKKIAEKNTVYAIIRLDERMKTLTYSATTYTPDPVVIKERIDEGCLNEYWDEKARAKLNPVTVVKTIPLW